MGSTVRVLSPASSAPVVVPAPSPASTVRLLTPGPPGASAYEVWLQAGHTGTVDDFLASLKSTVPGPEGVTTGFGQITYTDRAIGAEDVFPANVRQQLKFDPTAIQTQDLLNPPFKGHTFFTNNRLIARAFGDLYELRVNLLVTADQGGGQMRLDVDAGSILGPIQADTTSLFAGAGVTERVTFSFSIQVLANFLANGAAFYLQANRPVTVVSETLLLMPQSIQSGT